MMAGGEMIRLILSAGARNAHLVMPRRQEEA
jgi:hypothetical protein